MEQTNQFYKFQLFKELIEEITNLINKLQSQIIDIIKKSNNQPQTQSNRPANKLGLFQKLRSMWPFNKFVKECSLNDYLRFNEEIQNICDEIIKENFSIILEDFDSNQRISQALINFNNDFKNIIKKYSDILKKDYDKEVESYVKSTGSPDEITDSELESSVTTRSINKNKIENSIKKVLSTKSFIMNLKNDWFENGNIKFEFFGEILDYLLNEDVDIKNEEEIKLKLGSVYRPTESFFSILTKIYGNEDEINKIQARILNRDLIIGSIEEFFDKLEKLESPDQIRSTIEEIEEMNEKPEEIKKKIKDSIEREKDNEDLQYQLLFSAYINEDLRKQIITLLRSA